jgi:hypothetical protein
VWRRGAEVIHTYLLTLCGVSGGHGAQVALSGATHAPLLLRAVRCPVVFLRESRSRHAAAAALRCFASREEAVEDVKCRRPPLDQAPGRLVVRKCLSRLYWA